MRKYGLPYMGSKSAIADWVIDHLPPGRTLIDMIRERLQMQEKMAI